MKAKQPTLDDLGLGDKLDVASIVKTLPPLEPDPPRNKPRPVVAARPAQEPTKPEYPWLQHYMSWLKFLGIVGNVVFALVAMYAVAIADPAVFLDAVFGILGSNFFFVVAAMVQLALDAKADLATVARKLK